MIRSKELKSDFGIDVYSLLPTLVWHESNFIMVNGIVVKNRNSRPWAKQEDRAIYVSVDEDKRKFAILVGWGDHTDTRLVNVLRSTFTKYDFA